MYKVYVLQSITFPERHYIGYTENIERRIKEHNSAKTKSLVRYLPMKVIHIETYGTQQEAMRREPQIKKYKGGQAFKRLVQNNVTHASGGVKI